MRLPDISIHALREEGDLGFGTERLLRLKISIHALREEGDLGSTPRGIPRPDFYPRPPRGGRLVFLFSDAVGLYISIHALREEGDSANGRHGKTLCYFYPRPPRGGRLRSHGKILT